LARSLDIWLPNLITESMLFMLFGGLIVSAIEERELGCKRWQSGFSNSELITGTFNGPRSFFSKAFGSLELRLLIIVIFFSDSLGPCKDVINDCGF
jgi:hypothetical protein